LVLIGVGNLRETISIYSSKRGIKGFACRGYL